MNRVLQWVFNRPTIRLQFENDCLYYEQVNVIMRDDRFISMKKMSVDCIKHIDEDEFIMILNHMYEDIKRLRNE